MLEEVRGGTPGTAGADARAPNELRKLRGDLMVETLARGSYWRLHKPTVSLSLTKIRMPATMGCAHVSELATVNCASLV